MALKKYHVSTNKWSYNPSTSSSGVTVEYVNGELRFTGQATASYNFHALTNLKEGTYTLATNANRIPVNNSQFCANVYKANVITAGVQNNAAVSGAETFTINSDSDGEGIDLRIRIDNGVDYTGFVLKIMLNEGSTALPFEEYSSEVWHTTPYRKYETATDTFSTLPHEVIGDGQSNLTWSMDGNMQVNGTPSPQNPITPQETGEKTANLINPDDFTLGQWTNSSGVVSSQTYGAISDKIEINALKYTVKGHGETYPYSCSFCWYDNNDSFISRTHYSTSIINAKTPTVPNDAAYFKFQVSTSEQTAITLDIIKNFKIMLNEGSTALPYEPPNMYKIPISCNGVSYPIYLSKPLRKIGDIADIINSDGTVTRNIKTVDIGTLTFTKTSSGNFLGSGISNIRLILNGQSGNAICSHFTEASANSYANTPYSFASCINGTRTPVFNKTGFEEYTADQFKEAMSGVYMWYVLATPTTETFTAPSIPTSGTAQSFDVNTTLKPSEVSLTWHGWHEHTDTKYSNP